MSASNVKCYLCQYKGRSDHLNRHMLTHKKDIHRFMAPELVSRCLSRRQPILYIKNQFATCLVCNKTAKTTYGIGLFFNGYEYAHRECIKSFDKYKMYYQPLELEFDKFTPPPPPPSPQPEIAECPAPTIQNVIVQPDFKLEPSKAIPKNNLEFCMKQKMPLFFGNEFAACIICGDGCNEDSESPTIKEFKTTYRAKHADCISNFDTVRHVFESGNKALSVIKPNTDMDKMAEMTEMESRMKMLEAHNAELKAENEKFDSQIDILTDENTDKDVEIQKLKEELETTKRESEENNNELTKTLRAIVSRLEIDCDEDVKAQFQYLIEHANQILH